MYSITTLRTRLQADPEVVLILCASLASLGRGRIGLFKKKLCHIVRCNQCREV